MNKLLEKLLEVISDPVLIVVITGFALTIAILWRIFGKQHEFIKERIELLRQENGDLRNQLKEFKEENDRLRHTAAEMSAILADLQKQPLLSEKTTASLSQVAEKANYLIEFNQQTTKSIQRAFVELQDGFNKMEYISADSAAMIQKGIKEIEYVVSKKERTNEEISIVLNQLIEFIEETEGSKRKQLAHIKDSARQLLKR